MRGGDSATGLVPEDANSEESWDWAAGASLVDAILNWPASYHDVKTPGASVSGVFMCAQGMRRTPLLPTPSGWLIRRVNAFHFRFPLPSLITAVAAFPCGWE